MIKGGLRAACIVYTTATLAVFMTCKNITPSTPGLLYIKQIRKEFVRVLDNLLSFNYK